MDREECEARGAELCQQWTRALAGGLVVMLEALRPSIEAYGEMLQRVRDADRRR